MRKVAKVAFLYFSESQKKARRRGAAISSGKSGLFAPGDSCHNPTDNRPLLPKVAVLDGIIQ